MGHSRLHYLCSNTPAQAARGTDGNGGLISSMHAFMINPKECWGKVKERAIEAPEELLVQDENMGSITPLSLAIYNECELDVVKTFVELNPDIISIKDEGGRLPIHFAA